MWRYIAARVGIMMPVLLGTTFIIFAAVYALPGDPIQALAGQNREVPPSVVNALEAKYHLDEPLLTQYWYYITGAFTGDLGVDLNGNSVAASVQASWPVTVKLALTAWVLESIVGTALGVASAKRQSGIVDYGVLGGSILILGVPYFITAYVAQIVFGVKLGWLPVSGVADGWPLSYVVPAACLALFGLPEIIRITRVGILENLRADYVNTAVVKGLSPSRIMRRHVLRNSMIPLTSLLGVNLGYLLGGTILIEGIFNLPGLGYLVYQGVSDHNGPVVVGVSTLLVLVFLVVNLTVDVLYGALDPRIRIVQR